MTQLKAASHSKMQNVMGSPQVEAEKWALNVLPSCTVHSNTKYSYT
jgi:hypothetical protein